MSSAPERKITVAEYLAGEREGTIKHEYYEGQVFAQAGASPNHNRIAVRLINSLYSQLSGRGCEVYPSDMRIKVKRTGLYTYPDVTVTCGTEEFEDDHGDTLINPLVIIEVLSPSTESYDRGKKFLHYQMIQSLQEYLLVAQDGTQIEHYVRQPDDQWLYSLETEREGSVMLPSINCTLKLADVYKNIQFQQDL